MIESYGHTIGALRADRSRAGWVAIATIVAFAGGWGAWMVCARVPVFQTSAHARLEVVPAPSQVGAPIDGRVASSCLQVGKRVEAGDVLIELDSAPQQLDLARARAQLASLDPQLQSLDREIAAEGNVLTAGDSAARASLREHVSRLRAADNDLAFAQAELERMTSLAAKGAVPTMDVDRARAELAQKRSAREALGHAGDAQSASEGERAAGRRARAAELELQRAGVAATISTARADIARLELELDRHMIRAPIAGVLGSVAMLQPGAIVAAGAPIATIVPDGHLQLIAEYGPSAIGRLGAGQPARLKLDGFPWTRWGTVSAHVTSVGTEVRDGAIRVELALDRGATIPLVHGMTGSVDVEVEHVTPATLVLRSLVSRTGEDR